MRIMTDVAQHQRQAGPPAALRDGPPLAVTSRVKVLTPCLQTRLAIANEALRALSALRIVVSALELTPLDGGAPRIDLGVLSPPQAEQVLSMADASTRDADRHIYSAAVSGVRLVWGISQ